MNYQTEIKRIEMLASRIKPPNGLEPASSILTEGDMYTVKRDEKAETFVVVLKIQEKRVGVVYGHRRTEYAGPEDIIVPREVAGHRLVLTSDSFWMLKSSLDKPIGRLPSEWFDKLTQMIAWMLFPNETKPDVQTGLPYLDDKDIRWQAKLNLGMAIAFHQGIALEEDWNKDVLGIQ